MVGSCWHRLSWAGLGPASPNFPSQGAVPGGPLGISRPSVDNPSAIPRESLPLAVPLSSQTNFSRAASGVV